jgi:universal stress protein A
MPSIRRIVCPVDFSESSDHAARYAVGLARQLGASIHFVHAWQPPVYPLPDGPIILGPEVVARITDEARRALDAVAERFRDPELTIETRLLQGATDHEIVRCASEIGADLIVMGTHGRTGLAHLVLGSVAERVVRTAGVPVLCVPRERAPRSRDAERAHSG